MQINVNIMKSTPAFGTTMRFYSTSSGEEIGCNSWLFRDDVDWKKLTKFETANFADKDKVNVVMFAVSDGSEAYTKIISHYENNPKQAEKFLPITAYDIDSEILKAAKSGLINTCLVDRMLLQINSENYNDYFTETDKKLVIPKDGDVQAVKTFKAKKILTKNVRFLQGDMFQKISEIQDNSNTVLMCRNILGYFWNDKIEKFISRASDVLKSKSLFVIGDHDIKCFDMKSCLVRHNFCEVFKNVYKKL